MSLKEDVFGLGELFPQLSKSLVEMIDKVIVSIIILIIGIVVYEVLKKVVFAFVGKRVTKRFNEQKISTLGSLFSSIVKYFIYFVVMNMKPICRIKWDTCVDEIICLYNSCIMHGFVFFLLSSKCYLRIY